MDHQAETSEKKHKTQHFVSRFYAFLSLLVVLIMITAAYITYGYQVREVIVTLDAPAEDMVYKPVPALTINADTSRVPSDKDLKKVLNDVIPNRCDDCDDDPLDCLDEYALDKALVRSNEGHQLLYVHVLTGKTPHTYTIVLDLDAGNALVKKEGSIDKKECIDAEEEEEDVDPNDVSITVGEDPKATEYIRTQPR